MMSQRWCLASLAGGLCILLIAVAMAGYRFMTRPGRVLLQGRLEMVLAQSSAGSGWITRIEPIADTPEMRSRMQVVLNFDEALCASYVQANRRISVYLAYWKPDHMAYDGVVGHTPDVCWVANGWRMDAHFVNAGLRLANGEAVLPARQFKMSYQGRSEEVLYWHLTSSAARIARNESPPWYAKFAAESWLKHRGQEEQLVVRLSASGPVEDWWQSEPIQELVRNLPLRKTPARSL